MEPLLINEKLVSRFNFWADGKLQNGMRCSNELFRQVRTFAFDQRQRVYSLGWALAERGIQVVITWSHQGYGLWACLRVPHQRSQPLQSTQPDKYTLPVTKRAATKQHPMHSKRWNVKEQERSLAQAV
jgi:hypothetical protein